MLFCFDLKSDAKEMFSKTFSETTSVLICQIDHPVNIYIRRFRIQDELIKRRVRFKSHR